jgi:hypothetical protein
MAIDDDPEFYPEHKTGCGESGSATGIGWGCGEYALTYGDGYSLTQDDIEYFNEFDLKDRWL